MFFKISAFPLRFFMCKMLEMCIKKLLRVGRGKCSTTVHCTMWGIATVTKRWRFLASSQLSLKLKDREWLVFFQFLLLLIKFKNRGSLLSCRGIYQFLIKSGRGRILQDFSSEWSEPSRESVSISSLRLTCSTLNAGQLSNADTFSLQSWPNATGAVAIKTSSYWIFALYRMLDLVPRRTCWYAERSRHDDYF